MTEDDVDPEKPRPENHYLRFRDNTWYYVPDELATGDDERERVRMNLYHRHLPKLRDAGIVDYDWRSGDVVLAAESETFQPLLEEVEAPACQ